MVALLPLLLIPFLESYITKSERHIMVGDHEDIEKDLTVNSPIEALFVHAEEADDGYHPAAGLEPI